ncbi:hypothetical protein BGZ81_008957 [Podila clonocystis]|nr:hypothetical protein BGZ81_008957 [Podila clonocystis]
MIPSKRPSPFTRAKSFQTSNARKNMDSKSGQDTSSPPFAKRTFARTMSSPFQVVSPTMASTKNPFEKLSQRSVFASPSSKGSASLPEEYSDLNIKENGDSEDEIMDPNKTLQMFSFPQSSQPKADPDPEESDDEDEMNEEEEQPHILDEKKPSPFDSLKRTRRPHLQEALEMSLNRKSAPAKELEVPTILTDSSKTSSTKYTKRSTAPLDWTLKTGMSITSPDDLSWCDQRSSSEDIAALQWFNSERHQKHQTATTDPESARRRLLAAVYHWTYPTNAPSTPQAQSINRLLKSATNMSASEKASISEMFSRSSEWKQSFTALYQSYRNGACTYFYYMSKSWTILFQHGSISLSGELEAILTYSTPGLRKVLRDEDVGFVQLPDITGVKAVHSFSSKHDLEGSEDDEPSEISNLKGRSQIPKEKGLSDTLLFQGNAEVHGLFTYLLNLKASYEDGFLYQSPSLISSTPFLHAALKRAQISKCRVVSRPVEGSEKVQKEYRVEIQGTLLPVAVKVLWTVFTNRLATGCSFNATSDVRSHGLNLRPLLHESSSSDEGEVFVGPKALDQLRFDKVSNEYEWPTVDKGMI